MASICCSPPERFVPGWRAALGQDREQLVDALERPAARPAAVGADQQVLLDGQAGEDPPALGHQHDAAVDQLVARAARRPAARRSARRPRGTRQQRRPRVAQERASCRRRWRR